jgi:hypothetical protein
MILNPLLNFTYLIFRPWWYTSSPPQLIVMYTSSLCWIWLSYTSHQIFCPRCYLSSLPWLDCHVYFLSCWIWLSYTLLIKSFVLNTICPLLLDLIVMYTSTLSIHPLLVEFDCRLYFTNLIFCPWWYLPSPSWLDCSVYLGPNPIHLLVEFDCRVYFNRYLSSPLHFSSI